VRRLAAEGKVTRPPLLCLHPSPYGGIYFSTVMPMLNQGRIIVAPDYPGYGGSAPTESLPSIDDYALAMHGLLDAMNLTTVDVLGFHTGCLVGAELALRAASRVRRLMLIDVPYFASTERRDVYTRAVTARKLNAEFECLAGEWDRAITQRLGSMSFERAFELFVEGLRSGNRSHWGFHAAFTYPAEDRLPNVTTPTRMIATQSGLLDATREAARVLPNAELTERLDIARAVFEEGARRIADEIEAAPW